MLNEQACNAYRLGVRRVFQLRRNLVGFVEFRARFRFISFLMERQQFPGKQALSALMLTPLVIPGVILGISILSFSSRVASSISDDLTPPIPSVVRCSEVSILDVSRLSACATLAISSPACCGAS